MIKPIIIIFFCLFAIIFFSSSAVTAQEVSPQSDSFFLAKRKGILGRLGRSISRNGEFIEPVKTVSAYKKYQGRVIRSITIKAVGFNYNMNDTTPLKSNFIVKMANGLHRNSKEKLIRKNLFFKEGQRFYPLVAADNERFLREQTFLRDAVIAVSPSINSTDSVDVIVLTRDVFSIGGRFSVSSLDRVRIELREENFAGTGHRVAVFGMYDKNRKPVEGIGAEVILKNIKGSFINWNNGFRTFSPAFNSGRREEVNFYSQVEKPMASRYTAVTGAAEIAYHATLNGYLADSLYNNEFRYRYVNTDVWAGFNFGYNSGRQKDSENRLRHFVAMRAFHNNFMTVPSKYLTEYNYRYADINGVLMSYSLYRQNFYRANFIYGFGRSEDVPEGINATVIAGITNKQGVKRAYYGLEMDASKFTRKIGLYSYTVKAGGFLNNNKLQDVDVLLGVNHFTKLFKLNSLWYNRSFIGASYTRQLKTFLNEPLFLHSEFGLPYLRNTFLEGSRRTTINFETVFFNMQKMFGFRLAPFAFSSLSLLQPMNEGIKKTNGYPAIGGGIRTRNENLVFGTVELKGYLFPRVPEGVTNWKVELSTKLLFKYNSTFIRRPDFVRPN